MLDNADDLNERKGALLASTEWVHGFARPAKLRGLFHVLDYDASYGQLVLRSTTYSGERVRNLDLLFVGVRYLDLPHYLEHPTLSSGDGADFERIAGRCPFPLHRDYAEVFVIESGGRRFFVAAAVLKVLEHDLPPSESVVIRGARRVSGRALRRGIGGRRAARPGLFGPRPLLCPARSPCCRCGAGDRCSVPYTPRPLQGRRLRGRQRPPAGRDHPPRRRPLEVPRRRASAPSLRSGGGLGNGARGAALPVGSARAAGRALPQRAERWERRATCRASRRVRRRFVAARGPRGHGASGALGGVGCGRDVDGLRGQQRGVRRGRGVLRRRDRRCRAGTRGGLLRDGERRLHHKGRSGVVAPAVDVEGVGVRGPVLPRTGGASARPPSASAPCSPAARVGWWGAVRSPVRRRLGKPGRGPAAVVALGRRALLHVRGCVRAGLLLHTVTPARLLDRPTSREEHATAGRGWYKAGISDLAFVLLSKC